MLALGAPRRLFCLDALKLLAHGDMVSWNVVTTRGPLLGGEYTFFVLDKMDRWLHDARTIKTK